MFARTATNPFLIPNINYNTKTEIWKTMAKQNNLLDGKYSRLFTNTNKLVDAVHKEIFDLWYAGNFWVEGALVRNKCVAIINVTITVPYGRIINPTHTCNLDITWLLDEITEAYIFPGLSHSSLILTGTCCVVGWKVRFSKEEYRVFYKEKLAMIEKINAETGLWHLPVNILVPFVILIWQQRPVRFQNFLPTACARCPKNNNIQITCIRSFSTFQLQW